MIGMRYRYAGAGFARSLSFLCPMFLLVQALMVTVRLSPGLAALAWKALIATLSRRAWSRWSC